MNDDDNLIYTIVFCDEVTFSQLQQVTNRWFLFQQENGVPANLQMEVTF